VHVFSTLNAGEDERLGKLFMPPGRNVCCLHIRLRIDFVSRTKNLLNVPCERRDSGTAMNSKSPRTIHHYHSHGFSHQVQLKTQHRKRLDIEHDLTTHYFYDLTPTLV